tara:strand:- start:106 stop:519 length:414 start_codon:yes stop_codon:yes gene_type:complete
MNDPISWDPSLVKKYCSSNHYKLLNQLRNEVKKYPLNNKKNTTINQRKETTVENSNKSIIQKTQSIKSSNDQSHTNELHSKNSTVSFNNAKNFSIYNQTTNNNAEIRNESINSNKASSYEETSPATFKERLNKIDMK